ncbi:hypothetical protein [Streptacidiphilus sp. PB12-B1b]|uniref:hypothetical protein n=1 Tax=Streptacidiphilus sp. PB12-B1b TaxID=2705012 RepID=UPI0015F7B70E|nr:hypothetical protein [Streptacidiphilus sp. PB12-B1b]
MSLPAVAPVLSLLADDGGNHASLNPIVTGGGALIIFLILLFAVTRFNKDR